ncbi:general transcription factor 3C polypeptide 1 [Cotesia typhae]|uniref:general transcription factor 3C polypeptide 1 n=1 Tax=Cotesia typhae TaxID=2053667 RepID=UPI003D68AAF9
MHLTRVDNSVFAPSANLVNLVIDEIALEGLDGITLDTLWIRLGGRLQIQDEFSPAFKEQVWTICTSSRGINFYILETPRAPLIVYDRYEYVDPDLGIITEPDDIPDDIYEYYPVDDVKNGVKGSCKSYHTRKVLTDMDSVSLQEAYEKYGAALVIIASQELRQEALLGDSVSPTLELSVVQYCFLERVGRSRYHGEVTQGKNSLSVLNEDPKTLFYYRKLLLKHKLITKQSHYQKTLGHGSAGSLMHLPRFFVERKPKMVFLAERIIEMLKSRENYLMDYREIKKELQIEHSIKRLFKTSFFQKVARADLKVRYRELYPNAPDSEWQRKGCPSKEKIIQAVQLLDPKVDANTLWNKEDMADDEDCYDLDVSNQLLNEPLLKQANSIVERANVHGISQRDLGVQMGMTKLQSRTILRNLSKLNVIGTYMDFSGRQRVSKFVSKKYEKRSRISKQFNSEIRKMNKLRKETLNEVARPNATTAMDFFYPLGSSDNSVNITSIDYKTVETTPAIEYHPSRKENIDDPNIIVNDFETVNVDTFNANDAVRIEDFSEEQTFADTKGQIISKATETIISGYIKFDARNSQQNAAEENCIEATIDCPTAKECNLNIEMEIVNTPIKLEKLDVNRYHLFSVANKVLNKYSKVRNKKIVPKRSHFKVGFFNVARLDLSRLSSISCVNRWRRRKKKVKSAKNQNRKPKEAIASSVGEKCDSGRNKSNCVDTTECILPENFEPNPNIENHKSERTAVHPALHSEDHILPERIDSNILDGKNASRKRVHPEESLSNEDISVKRIKISSNLFNQEPSANTEMNAVINIEPDDYNLGFYDQDNYYNEDYPEGYYNEGYNPEGYYNAEGYNPENCNAEGYNPEESYNIEDNYDNSWVDDDDDEKIIDATTTSTAFSYRMLKRLNMIITMVKEHKVIDDPSKLMKMINQQEESEGCDVKMDKKSLMRMLQRLARDNLVKNMKLTLSDKGRKKVLFFVCDKNINVNHSVIQSAVEQAKIKFCLTPPTKKVVKMNNRTGTFNETSAEPTDPTKADAKVLVANDKDNEKVPALEVKYDLKAGRDYGYKPKFIRMKIMHKLLFYLIYEYKGENLSKIDQIERLRAEGNEISDKMAEEISEIYYRDVDWRMFIPPLPEHSTWEKGWAMISDVILRLPLSIFLEIHKLPFYLPALNYFLNHPIRKHYLMKDLPMLIRSQIFRNRKYIYSIIETIQRLAYIGLVQFGPQKFKEKDHVFIYLNTRSQLVDTTPSAPGYHKIEEREYSVQSYTFDRLQTVENYWYDMWQICVCTRLGGRQAVEGTEITLEDLTKKPEMIQCLKQVLPNEVSSQNLGILPGDRKGAAGIDSAFFSHLKRNWNWENFNSSVSLRSMKKQSDKERTARLAKVEVKPLKYTEFKGLKKVTGPTTISANNPPVKKPKVDIAPPKLVVSTITHRPDKIVRKVLPRKRQERKRVHYDEVDHQALQNMKMQRVNWDAREDHILSICKIVMVYLCPNPRAQLLSFAVIRDVLKFYSKTSINKTSRACQRRMFNIYKRPQVALAVTLGVEELKENPYIRKKYHNIVDVIRSNYEPHQHDEKITSVFKDICHYVARKHHLSQKDPPESTHQPATLGEFHLLFKISRPQGPEEGFTKSVRNTNDIHSSTINSIIFSSICSGKDRRSSTYQLYRIYQQYPEFLLKSAITQIKNDKTVSIKKQFESVLKRIGNGCCMPMTSSQIQLSCKYNYIFQSIFSLEIFSETQVFLQKLIEGYASNSLGLEHGVEFDSPTRGVIIGLQEFLANQNLDFNIKIPDYVIVLDQEMPEHDMGFKKVAERYQNILCSLENPETREGQDKEKQSQDLEQREDMSENDDSPADISVVAVKATKKNVLRKDSWGWQKSDTGSNGSSGLILNSSSQSNIRRPVRGCHFILDDSDDELEIKTLIDGREIIITKSDIDNNKSSFIENDMHEAFRQTKLGNLNDLPETLGSDDQEEDPREALLNLVNQVTMGTSIDELNRIVNEHIPMDVDDEWTTKQSIRCAAVKRRGTDQDDGFEFVNIEDFSNDNNEEPEIRRNVSNMVNDIIANVNYYNESRNQSRLRDEDTGETRKNFTRIALLKVRAELNEKLNNLPDSHHAHEYFAVSKFRLYYSMPKIDKEIIANPHFVIDDRVKENLFLLKNNSYKNVVQDLNKLAVFPKDRPDYESIKEDLETQGTIESFEIDLIYDYVRNKREQGATLKELTNKFYRVLEEKLYDILSYMTNCHLFLRSGVTEMHYIHYCYAEPWYVESIKILRLLRESLPLFPPGSVYVFNSTNHYAQSTKVSDTYLSEKITKVVDFGDCIEDDDDDDGDKNSNDNDNNNENNDDNHLNNKTVEDDNVTNDNDNVDQNHENNQGKHVNVNKNAEDNQENIPKVSKNSDDNDKNSDDNDNNNKNDDDSHLNNKTVEDENVTNGNDNENADQDHENTNQKNDRSEEVSVNKNTEDNQDNISKVSNNSDVKVLYPKSSRGNIGFLLQTQDIDSAIKNIDFSSAEKINVVVRPWIRIDGTVNRMILEKMLGAILSHCLVHPGIALSQVQTKFVPALQPYHTRELVEILVKLDCLSLRVVRKPPCTLFSSASSIKLYYPAKNDGSSELESEIIVETTIGAAIKFGTFIRYYLSRKANINDSNDNNDGNGKSKSI